MRKNPVPPHKLFDYIMEVEHLKLSSDLAKFLGCTQGYISKVRHGVNKPTAELILLVFDKTGLPIPKIRMLLEDSNG